MCLWQASHVVVRKRNPRLNPLLESRPRFWRGKLFYLLFACFCCCLPVVVVVVAAAAAAGIFVHTFFSKFHRCRLIFLVCVYYVPQSFKKNKYDGYVLHALTKEGLDAEFKDASPLHRLSLFSRIKELKKAEMEKQQQAFEISEGAEDMATKKRRLKALDKYVGKQCNLGANY